MQWLKGLGIGCLWLVSAHVWADSVPATATSTRPPPKFIVVRDDRPPPYHPTVEQAALLHTMAVRDAEPDRLTRCLHYPDPPGVRWNQDTVAVLCRVQFEPLMTLSEITAQLASVGPKSIERRFDLLRKEQLTKESSWKLDETFRRTFGCACKEARDAADAWMAKSPDSRWAYMASGIQHSAAAEVARGTDSIQSTGPERIARMEELDRRASVDLEHALKLDPGSTPAIDALINVDTREGRVQEARNRLADAFREYPDSFALHQTAAWLTQPKWGGSDSELQHERERAQAASTTNPLLNLVVTRIDRMQRTCDDCKWTLQTYEEMNRIGPSLGVLRDATSQAREARDYAGAAIYASELFRFSPTNESWAHTERGFARDAMGDLDGAQADGEAALAGQADYQPALGLMRMLSYRRAAAAGKTRLAPDQAEGTDREK